MVKAKLVELGEYVDDQLTDYVVIMVTNKKSEKQIAEDLELFLGGLENATNFSAWWVFSFNINIYFKELVNSKFFLMIIRLQQVIRNLIAESELSKIKLTLVIFFSFK